MIITYFGHSFLHVAGKEYSIALDPFSNIGLDIPKVSSTYIFCSHEHFDHNNRMAVNGAKEVKDGNQFKIIPTFHDDNNGKLRGENKILLFELSGYKLAFMGDYGESYNDNVVKALSGVDVLFIPIGGKYTINSETAVNYIKEIKPKTVIPIHYKVDGSNIDIKGPNEFLKLVKEYNIKSSPYNYNGEKGVILLSPISEV